jgi:hypothetical protein
MNPVLFSTNETAELLGVKPQALLDFIKLGIIRPASPGRAGRGCQHQFTGQQALALAAIDVMTRSSRGCRVEYAQKIVEHYEGMPDAALKFWAGREDAPSGADEWDAEPYWAWYHGDKGKRALICPLLGPAEPWDDGDRERANECISQLFLRIEYAVRLKLLPLAPVRPERGPGPMLAKRQRVK